MSWWKRAARKRRAHPVRPLALDLHGDPHGAQQHRLRQAQVVALDGGLGRLRIDAVEHLAAAQVGVEAGLDGLGSRAEPRGHLGEDRPAIELGLHVERAVGPGRGPEDLVPQGFGIGAGRDLVGAAILGHLAQPERGDAIARGHLLRVASMASMSSRVRPTACGVRLQVEAHHGQQPRHGRAADVRGVEQLPLPPGADEISLVSNVLPPLLAGALLAGARGDQLVERGPLVLGLAEDPAEPLHVLPHRPRPGEDDGDVGLRHVDPLVEHLGGDHRGELARVERGEDAAPLLELGLMGDRRQEEAARDRIDRGVVLREHDGAISRVVVVEPRQHGVIARRAPPQRPLPPVGRERAPARVALRREHEEAPPPLRAPPCGCRARGGSRGRCRDRARRSRAPRPRAAPPSAPSGRRRGTRRELGDVLAIDDGPDGVLRRAQVGALGRGGQAQAERRQSEPRRQPVGGARQVVALVEDDQPKAIAEPVHVQVRRVVRGHREVEHLVVAAAHDADRETERPRQHVVPLVQQIERRHHDERAALPREDRERRHVRLPRAGRQHDHAAVAVPPPRLQRLGLVGERLVPRRGRERERGVLPRLVHRLDAAIARSARTTAA